MQREPYDKCSAFSDFGLEPDIAVMFFHDDGVSQSKPLPCSFPDFLGGEKGLKNSGPIFFRYPSTGILNSDFGTLAIVSGGNCDGSFTVSVLPLKVTDGVRGIN